MVTEREILEELEKAEEVIRKAVEPYNRYVDDFWWGDSCFRINVFREQSKKEIMAGKPAELTNWFSFSYDEDEEFYGTLQEQVKNKLDTWVYEFKYNMEHDD